jgi:hypothetical protein
MTGNETANINRNTLPPSANKRGRKSPKFDNQQGRRKAMNVDAYIRNLQELGIRILIFEISVTIAITIIVFWLTYHCIKAAVRDGIKESGINKRTHEKPPAPPGYRWALVRETEHSQELRAD